MLSKLLAFFKSSEPKTLSVGSEDEVKLRRLEKVIQLEIKNPQVFLKALRHKSTLSEARYNKTDSYERLEFLGDAVLDLVVTEIIFRKFPTKNEGFLTKLRAKIVKGESLALFSHMLGFNEILEYGERTRSAEIQMSKSVMADVFEAVVGAIYSEYGYDKASVFIQNVIKKYVDFKEIVNSLDNNKSLLLELTQAHRLTIPFYNVVDEYGPGHDKTFEIEVIINDRGFGMAVGKSKKQAEQKAARLALDILQTELVDSDQVP